MVENEISTVEYELSTSTGPFDIPFYFIENDHIAAQIYDPSDDTYNPTTLVLNQDYYLSGAGNESGGQLTLATAHAGKILFIFRDPDATQLTSYQDTGKFPAASHERALDKLTMLIQRDILWWDTLALKKPNRFASFYDAEGNRIANLADPVNTQDAVTKNYVDTLSGNNFSRTLRTPEVITSLPDVEMRKNKLVAMDDAGNPLMVLPESGSAADVLIELAKPTGFTYIGGLAEHYSLPKTVIVVDNAPYNGDLKAALDAATSGATLLLGKRDYDITGYYSSGRNTKTNISIIGVGMPYVSSDKSRFVSGSGSVIQGAVKNQAKGFKLINVGVDCGNYVSQNLYSTTTYEDCVVIYGAGDKCGCEVSNLITLNSIGISSNPATHAVLLEQSEGILCNGLIECIGGFHGFTMKCQNLWADRIKVHGQYGDGYIFKSDGTGSVCAGIHINSLVCGHINASEYSYSSCGGLYDAADSVGIDRLIIGSLTVQNATWGLVPTSTGTGHTTNIHIGKYICINAYGNYYSLIFSALVVNATIGQHMCQNVSGGIEVHYNSAYVNIGDGAVTGSSVAGYKFGGNTNSHGRLIANANGTYGVEYTQGMGFDPSNVIGYGNSLGNFSALPSVLSGSVLNGWTTQTDFKATPHGHRVFISGSLTKGTAANAWLIATNLRPAVDTPISAWGVNASSTMVPVEAYVRTTGYLEITGYASLGSTQAVRINGSYLMA
nr:phage tail protein [Kosakonia radicincitans]